MPLDRQKGEELDGLDGEHIVIDYRHLASLSNVVTEYQVPHPFKRIVRKRPIFDDALAVAGECFAEAGALIPVVMDESQILAQLYPEEMKVAIIVGRTIAGEERYVVRCYDVPSSVMDTLLQTARKAYRAH